MGLRFIRQPSDEPSISNSDDTRMIRYAYGGYNGYVKGKGAEVSHTISGSTFKINSGVVSLQGYETEIDSNGWEMTVVNTPTKRYFSVWYEVNLAMQTVKLDSNYDTAGYPTVLEGDDLTSASTGTARLLLYHFTATSGVITDVAKKVEQIPYAKALIENEASARESADTAITEDIEDGTIVAYKATRDENNDIIHNTYRKKSERVLFYTGNFVVLPTETSKSLVRNTGSAVIVDTSIVEIEFQFTSPSWGGSKKVRQTIQLGGELTTCPFISDPVHFFSANTAYTSSSSITFNFVKGFDWFIAAKTGSEIQTTLTITKVWIVE